MLHRSRVLQTFGLILLGASALQAGVLHVERPDAMQVYFLTDVDRLGDRVRVLYHTLPSLEQQTRDDWTVNVYVAELHPDGSVKQQRLVSSQRRYGALLLRRGHDEVFLIPAPGPPGSGQAQLLEVRSTRDGSVRSSVEPDVLPNVQLGSGNIGPTDDGNLIVVGVSTTGSRGEATGIVWHKLSAEGEILGKGEYENGGARVGYHGLFPARDGGVGLTVGTSVSREVERLPTDIDNPVKRTVDGRTVEAEVHSETRLLLADAKGRLLKVSEAVERTFMWDFRMPQDVPPEKQVQLTAENMRLQEEIGLEYGMRIIEHMPHGGNDTDWIRPTPHGYAMLAGKSIRRDRVPPASGPYYLEVGPDGAIRREVYLGLLAEEIGARKFLDFLPTDDGGFLLVGHRTPEGTRKQELHVTRVAPDGKPTSIISAGPRGWQFEGVAGTASNVWLIGHEWSDEHRRTLLVLEQVDMAGARPLVVEEQAAPATPEPVEIPSFEPPASQPSKDCSCSCEEFAELKKMFEGVEKMSDADKMKLVTDPEYLKKLNCMAQCGVAYSQCTGQ